jgi:hypothetical protein
MLSSMTFNNGTNNKHLSCTFTSFAANNFAAERGGHLNGAETSAIDSGCWRAEELGELKRNETRGCSARP